MDSVYTLTRGDGRRCALVRVRFLSELEKAEGKGRAENSEFEDRSRRESDCTVSKSPYPARMLANPRSLPSGSSAFSQDKGHLP